MDHPETKTFYEFYSQLDAKRLGAVCEGLQHDGLEALRKEAEQAAGAGEEAQVVRDLLAKLPGIIADLSAAVCVHLLHEYHEWLTQAKPSETGAETKR